MSGYRLPYRSKFEVKVAADLGKRKVDFQYEKVKFDYIPKIRNYTPDFYLPEYDIYLEIKGYWTEAAKWKMRDIMVRYPGKIRLLESLEDISKLSKPVEPTPIDWKTTKIGERK